MFDRLILSMIYGEIMNEGYMYKKIEGIEVIEKNIPLITEKLMGAEMECIEWDLYHETLFFKNDCQEIECGFGATICINSDGISLANGDIYEIYDLMESEACKICFNKLYRATNIKEINIHKIRIPDSRITITLENDVSFTNSVIDSLIVFDKHGDFVTLIERKGELKKDVLKEHGYKPFCGD